MVAGFTGRLAGLGLAVCLVLALGPLAAGAAETGLPAPSLEPAPLVMAPGLAPSPLSPGPVAPASPRSDVQVVWTTPGISLAERVDRTRTVIRELGVGSFDAAARALLANPAAGDPEERAEYAVAVAPWLPFAWGALAQARWEQRHDLLGSVRALVSGLLVLDRHLEASLWWRANGLLAVAFGLCGGAVVFLALACAFGARRAAHDLGDRVLSGAPEFGRVLLLGCLVLVPLALGEGMAGLALGLFGLAFACSDRRGRIAQVAAAAALAAALFPVLDRAGSALAGLSSDRVALAAFAVERETATPGELVRLERAADSDPLASRALAVRARRLHDLAEADARYAQLLEGGALDPILVNNAANVRLALGDSRAAIALYEQATARVEDATLLFNLSHAHGAAIHPDLQDATLAYAQALDADLVGELTDLLGSAQRGLVLDLPFPVSLLRGRLAAGPPGVAVAGELRKTLAPGRLGRSPIAFGLAFAAVAFLAALLTRKAQPTGWCSRCGARRCPRCDDAQPDTDLCESCTRLALRPETTDPALRIERLNELRARQRWRERVGLWVGALVPGAAGLWAGRPLLGLVGAFAGCGAIVAAIGLRDSVPDPLAAGLVGGAAFAIAAASLLALHVLVATWALRRRGD